MKRVFWLSLLIIGCSSSSDSLKLNPGEVPVYECKGVTYFYTVSALDSSNLKLILDDRVHSEKEKNFSPSECVRKTAPAPKKRDIFFEKVRGQ